eukprot:10742895-Alexandrium_andersonii.AAC.1
MAMYAVFSSPVSSEAMRMLRSAVADALDRGAASNRSVAWIFEACETELDPLIWVVVVRAQTARRL